MSFGGKTLFRRGSLENLILTHITVQPFPIYEGLCIKFREISVFACIDDKHRIKVGEPGFPVASAERGRQVMYQVKIYFCCW